jgi:type IV pilus assembly protein PilV
MRSMHRSEGFSLVEVLVSIVILSVALLGTAGLTAASLKSNNTAYYRSQATFLADDIIDRMRANIVQARGGQYDIDKGEPGPAADNTIELFDCEEWATAVENSLPGGAGSVTVVANVATVVIMWDKKDDDSYENSFTTVTQL